MYDVFQKAKHRFDCDSGTVTIIRDTLNEFGVYSYDGYKAKLSNLNAKPLRVYQQGYTKSFLTIPPGSSETIKSINGTWLSKLIPVVTHTDAYVSTYVARNTHRSDSHRTDTHHNDRCPSDTQHNDRCHPHKCCPKRGPQGPEGPMGPPGPAGQLGLQGLKGDPGDKGLDATITQEHLASITLSLAHLAAPGPQGVQGPSGPTGPQGLQGVQGPQGLQGPPGFSCCPDKYVSEGSRTVPGFGEQLSIHGGNAVLFTCTLVGGGGGGGGSSAFDVNGSIVEGNGGGSGYIVSGQFIVPTNTAVNLYVGGGGKGGKLVGEIGGDGEDTYVSVNGVKQMLAYGGSAPTAQSGGKGYFGGGGRLEGGLGLIRNGYSKSPSSGVNVGFGGGYNAGKSGQGNVGCGGGSSPMNGFGGDGGVANSPNGTNGTIGGGGGGAFGIIQGGVAPTGGDGGNGLIVYSYRVF